mgnify:CR=1 FL=1
MDAALANILCTLIAFIATTAMSIALLINYRKNHIKTTIYLTMFFLLLALHNLIFLLASITSDSFLALLLFKFTFLGPLGVLFSLLFAESLRKPSPYTQGTFIGSLLFMISFVDGLVFQPKLIYQDGYWYALQLRSYLGYLALLGFYLYSSFFVIYIYHLMHKKAKTPFKRKQTLIFLLVSILGFVGTISVITIELFFFPKLVLEFLVVGIATSILGLAYLSNPYIAFLLIHDIYKIMVIQKSGLLCYCKNLTEHDETDDHAIAGLIHAIFSFGVEVLGVKKHEKDIDIISYLCNDIEHISYDQ